MQLTKQPRGSQTRIALDAHARMGLGAEPALYQQPIAVEQFARLGATIKRLAQQPQQVDVVAIKLVLAHNLAEKPAAVRAQMLRRPDLDLFRRWRRNGA